MTPEEMMDAALAVAEDGLAAGELPIGAVVLLGDEIVGRAYTQERALRRRIVHADLLAMDAADRVLGWRKREHPLRLAVTLEPCVMCLGAAMTLGVTEIVYALESPGDGAAVLGTWRPETGDLPGYAVPVLVGGVRRAEARELFRRYCDQAPDSGMRRWARTLLDRPN
ncbi:nucleoside deaminase [Catellatospora sichuanensis]|uniref:nucleoside deaminase n=1 Tax=Catellatospora sichuanensis TaxID=1969805 RepID=UPI001C91D9B2|nr:deaminase [Catellatospora sichuanensis]